MISELEELVGFLDLERIDEDIFRGQPHDPGWGQLFGGHVFAQALRAAQGTVAPERLVHSVHGYFLLLGDISLPLVYQVFRTRDGGTFSTRSVVARQRGRTIFQLSASFQVEEGGFVHQDEMPQAPPPDSLPTEEEALTPFASSLPKGLRERLLAPRAFELRPVQPTSDPLAPAIRPPVRDVWIRGRGKLRDDPSIHAALVAYVSDYFFLGTAMQPHGVTWLDRRMQVASLDHSIWFHDRARADEWLLHSMESPRAAHGRGLVRGQIFSADGRLVASTAQEGLIRRRS
ncbi:acyl-CoA thioesterase [Vulgatibacter sp.]|uniref:acyl-CoA thioesterase n=1 Tax=Vulgatibacter sp. TaxID=1971226 RepID=UPI003561BFC0